MANNNWLEFEEKKPNQIIPDKEPEFVPMSEILNMNPETYSVSDKVKLSQGDIDIDVADREQVIQLLKPIIGSLDNQGRIHPTAVFLQNIPAEDGISTINASTAEELGYYKLDILNVNLYRDISNEIELRSLMDSEPMWSRLRDKEFVKELYHIGNHYDIVQLMEPESIYDLAVTIALIRPAARHLKHLPKDEIKQKIWELKPEDGYAFKKSHSFAYAQLIIVQMNWLESKGWPRKTQRMITIPEKTKLYPR